MFEFATAPIEPERLKTSLFDATAGGYAAFEGWVRDRNDGQRVTQLEYEAYEVLALREGARIVAEAMARFGVHRARCVHRLGSLAVGELAVWVGVASAHRSEAFAACRYIIDEVKHRVPIWKKEHYAGGDSGWVNCERCAAPSDATTLPAAAPHVGHHHDHAGGQRAAPRFDYSRQVTLAEVGVAGQARLARARVLVTGAGGLGCPVLLYLAGAGVGTLGIVDADVVEASNLHRQPLYTLADVGRAKAVVAAERLRAFNPDIEVRVHAERFGAANGATLLADYDVVVDCSDNFATKFLVNDAAVLAGKPAVLASVYQYEGQLQVVRPDAGGSCLRCLWPEATRDGLVGNCAESGVLGPVPGLFGNLQALETLKLLLDLPGQLRDEVLVLDLLGASLHRLRARRSADCADGPCRRITAPAPAPADLEVALPPAEAVRAGYTLVDIREPAEIAAHPLPGPGCLQIPMPSLLAEPGQLPPGPRYLLVCARGQRSRATAVRLRAAGIAAHSMQGGVATLT